MNRFAIGIEHVGLSQQGADEINRKHAAMTAKDGKTRPHVDALPCTEVQYQKSMKLIAWVCMKMRKSINRTVVRTHNESSPRDGHTFCCTGALDPDRVVRMAADYALRGTA